MNQRVTGSLDLTVHGCSADANPQRVSAPILHERIMQFMDELGRDFAITLVVKERFIYPESVITTELSYMRGMLG